MKKILSIFIFLSFIMGCYKKDPCANSTTSSSTCSSNNNGGETKCIPVGEISYNNNKEYIFDNSISSINKGVILPTISIGSPNKYSEDPLDSIKLEDGNFKLNQSTGEIYSENFNLKENESVTFNIIASNDCNLNTVSAKITISHKDVSTLPITNFEYEQKEYKFDSSTNIISSGKIEPKQFIGGKPTLFEDITDSSYNLSKFNLTLNKDTGEIYSSSALPSKYNSQSFKIKASNSITKDIETSLTITRDLPPSLVTATSNTRSISVVNNNVTSGNVIINVKINTTTDTLTNFKLDSTTLTNGWTSDISDCNNIAKGISTCKIILNYSPTDNNKAGDLNATFTYNSKSGAGIGIIPTIHYSSESRFSNVSGGNIKSAQNPSNPIIVDDKRIYISKCDGKIYEYDINNGVVSSTPRISTNLYPESVTPSVTECLQPYFVQVPSTSGNSTKFYVFTTNGNNNIFDIYATELTDDGSSLSNSEILTINNAGLIVNSPISTSTKSIYFATNNSNNTGSVFLFNDDYFTKKTTLYSKYILNNFGHINSFINNSSSIYVGTSNSYICTIPNTHGIILLTNSDCSFYNDSKYTDSYISGGSNEIYATTNDGYLYKKSAPNTKHYFSSDDSQVDNISSNPIISNNFIYAVSNKGNLYAKTIDNLDAKSVSWICSSSTKCVNDSNLITTPPIIGNDGTVYIFTGTNEQPIIYALTQNIDSFTEKWSFALPHSSGSKNYTSSFSLLNLHNPDDASPSSKTTYNIFSNFNENSLLQIYEDVQRYVN